MATLLLVILSSFNGVDQQTATNRQIGAILVACARTGVPPEAIRAVFGSPSRSKSGRFDWRTNPDRYLLWDYTRYGVWVEWEASPFPRTGFGSAIRVSGSILP